MDRDKLIEIIDSNGRFNLPTVELECLADHLIANGIGDITAEKHRAEVAEEALRLACLRYDSEKDVCEQIDCDLISCGSEKCVRLLTNYFKQQAKQYSKEE